MPPTSLTPKREREDNTLNVATTQKYKTLTHSHTQTHSSPSPLSTYPFQKTHPPHQPLSYLARVLTSYILTFAETSTPQLNEIKQHNANLPAEKCNKVHGSHTFASLNSKFTFMA